jgi:hypothetical protein
MADILWKRIPDIHRLVTRSLASRGVFRPGVGPCHHAAVHEEGQPQSWPMCQELSQRLAAELLIATNQCVPILDVAFHLQCVKPFFL